MQHEQMERAGFSFMISDLELALTLTHIAATSSNNAAKRARNQSNARRAYDTVRKLAGRAVLSASQRAELDEHATRLKAELEKLGETF